MKSSTTVLGECFRSSGYCCENDLYRHRRQISTPQTERERPRLINQSPQAKAVDQESQSCNMTNMLLAQILRLNDTVDNP